MGTATNKRKEEVAEAILEAAMDLFTTKGVEKTSMRNIAQQIGYTAGNVYLYFKNKAEILHTLHSRGFVRLGAKFKVLQVVADPLERLKAMGRVYLQFAADNPQLYRLMFISDAPMLHLDDGPEEQWSEGNNTFGVLKTTLEECLQHGHFSGHHLEPLSFIVWSTTHGMASLANAKRITRVKFEDPDTIVNIAYDEFCLMLDRLR